MHGWTDGQTDRQTDEQKGEQTIACAAQVQTQIYN